ncbi:MAG: SpoIID/LytB domain-containing protein [Actinomycetota bacterium]
MTLAAPQLNVSRAAEVAGPIRLVPLDEDSWVRLNARFKPQPELCPAKQPRNLHAGYPGILEIGRRSDGRMYLVTELTFPRYLKGIAEVPRDWPLEALKAQVVAARTYAISHMNPSDALARELRYNLCATDRCQVYRGRIVEAGAWGEEWTRAVDETVGEVLEHNGRPASTFYFSTSNGRTYSNADAFGGSPLPYLKPITESDDTQSPLSNWSVTMPLPDLAETLSRARVWGGEPVQEVVQEGESVRISGGGRSASFSLVAFRNHLNSEAVCLEPKRYPTIGSNGRPMPQVIPSKWMNVMREGDAVVVTGRGWGHGVGMVQWGLKGKAERGMTHAEMLAFYYGGIRPTKREEPGQIRVGLAVDIEEMAVELNGRFRVEGAQFPNGPVVIRAGSALSVEPGPGIASVLTIEKVSGPSRAASGGSAELSFELSSAARVRLSYRGPGEAQGETAAEPKDRGQQTFAWDPGDLPGGAYEVRLVATDGVDEVASDPIQLKVEGPSPSPTPKQSPSRSPAAAPPERTGSSLVIAGVGLLGLVALGAVALLMARGARRRKT